MEPEKRTRLAQLLGMLGSAHDGEVLNAARLACRLIGSEAMTWTQVLNGEDGGSSNRDQEQYNFGYAAGYARATAEATITMRERKLTWFAFVRELRDDFEEELTTWEQGFVESFIERGWAKPTPKQRTIFERIADKFGLECPE